MNDKRLYSYDRGNNKILCNLNDVCDFNVFNVFKLINSLSNENEKLINKIEKQKRIIKSQDAEISRQYKLCLAMSGILREEFGVYDVFDRTKDKKRNDLR